MARTRTKLLSWITDKNKRARMIIWLGVVVIFGLGFMAVALGVTSSYWFCANVCHKVQDDTIIAYNRAPHSKISCITCHMPVNADIVTFMLHKMEGLGELYRTVTGDYELPLNPESEVAEVMPSVICTQCHSVNRRWTFTEGLVMNHTKHTEKGISCTTCHNRTAHIEDFKLVGKSPDGTPSHKHEVWMTMEACFRCHNLNPSIKGTVKGASGLNAPGKCELCHTPTFELKPDNHFVANFQTKGHPALFKLRGEQYCSMCHDQKTFCTKCHGVDMPHPADWLQKHSDQFKNAPAATLVVCRRCHPGANFCSECHHGKTIGWTYEPAVPWRAAKGQVQQHPTAAKKVGAAECTKCHKDEKFCSPCHINGGNPPAGLPRY
jgi:hypothetical protein